MGKSVRWTTIDAMAVQESRVGVRILCMILSPAPGWELRAPSGGVGGPPQSRLGGDAQGLAEGPDAGAPIQCLDPATMLRWLSSRAIGVLSWFCGLR